MFHTGWSAFVTTFALFAFLLTGGNVWAEMSPNLTLGRVTASILTCVVLAWPAVLLFVLFDMRRAPPAIYRAWRWFWLFGFLAYAIHAYFSVGVWFAWDFAQIERRQTRLVAWTNYVLLAAWGLEVLIAVVFGARDGAKVWRLFQWFTHALFVAAFVVAAVVFHNEHKTPLSLVIGWALAGTTALAVLTRLIWGDGSKWSSNALSEPGVTVLGTFRGQ